MGKGRHRTPEIQSNPRRRRIIVISGITLVTTVVLTGVVTTPAMQPVWFPNGSANAAIPAPPPGPLTDHGKPIVTAAHLLITPTPLPNLLAGPITTTESSKPETNSREADSQGSRSDASESQTPSTRRQSRTTQQTNDSPVIQTTTVPETTTNKSTSGSNSPTIRCAPVN